MYCYHCVMLMRLTCWQNAHIAKTSICVVKNYSLNNSISSLTVLLFYYYVARPLVYFTHPNQDGFCYAFDISCRPGDSPAEAASCQAPWLRSWTHESRGVCTAGMLIWRTTIAWSGCFPWFFVVIEFCNGAKLLLCIA